MDDSDRPYPLLSAATEQAILIVLLEAAVKRGWVKRPALIEIQNADRLTADGSLDLRGRLRRLLETSWAEEDRKRERS